MNIFSRTTLLVASLGLFMALPALALEPLPDMGGGTRDWNQLWIVSDAQFDHIQFLMVTPGAGFADPGIGPAPLPDNWLQTFDNGQLLIADGDPVTSLTFRTYFTGVAGTPLMFYMQLWNGTQFVSESTAAWDGTKWTVTGGSPWANVRVHGVAVAPEWQVTTPPEAALSLVADASCYHVDDLVTVQVLMTNASQTVVSGQYWLSFNPAKLLFVSAEPGDPSDPPNPFDEEVYEFVNQAAGKLDYSSGVPTLADGTSADTILATFTFQARAEACLMDNLVTFRPYDPADPHPPTRLSNDFAGGAVYAILWELPTLTIDSTPPVHVGCPGGDPLDPPEVTVECDLLDALYPVYDDLGELLVTATDNCDPAPVVTFAEVRTDGLCPQQYDLLRTWTVTDVCGNSADCALLIHVVDTTSPTLRGCPRDATVECDEVPVPADVTATDFCDPAPVVTYVETRIDGACPFNYTLLREWTATDACGNSACCAQTITVQDTEAPELTGCPDDVAATCDAIPPAATVTATDNCTVAVSVAFEEIESDHECDDTYTLTRIWTATDECGNVTVCEQVITVYDDQAPLLAGCPDPEITVECDAIPDPPVVSVSDNCDPTPTLLFFEVRTDGDCPHNYVLTRTWSAEDRCGNAAECVQVITVEDTTAPTIVCPADIAQSADVGGCTASLCPGAPETVADNCDEAPTVYGLRSDGLNLCEDPYPVGITTITWYAVDACGNAASCPQTVEILPYNDVEVTIGLQGTVFTPLTRCVTFELWECGTPITTVVDWDMTFVDGVATATVQVPCSDVGYTCITARDKLHTLRRTLDPLPIEGTRYVADFVAADKPLLGGNLNDDYWLDTLDFGTYIFQLSTNFGIGDTPCGTPPPHADVDGNGLVWTEDFTFIAINFLQHHEPNCCGAPLMPGDGSGPVVRITARQLRTMGLGHLMIADLNHDGVVDPQDIEAHMNGAMPPAGDTHTETADPVPLLQE